MSPVPYGRDTPPGAPRAGQPLPGPVFLERAGYRRRRIVDAVRLMPVLGALLWAVPLLWSRGAPGASGAEATQSSAALLYIFGVWLLLVIGAALLSRAVRRSGWDAMAETGEAGDAKNGGGGAR